MAMEPLIGGGKTQFDATKFTWLGSATDEVSVCVTTWRSPVKTYEDMLKTEFSVGGEGGGFGIRALGHAPGLARRRGARQ